MGKREEGWREDEKTIQARLREDERKREREEGGGQDGGRMREREAGQREDGRKREAGRRK